MTKQEILDALEALKDSTNENGKKSIGGIKAAILQNLSERLELPLATVDVPPEEVEDHNKQREAQQKAIKEAAAEKRPGVLHSPKKHSKFKSGGRLADK